MHTKFLPKKPKGYRLRGGLVSLLLEEKAALGVPETRIVEAALGSWFSKPRPAGAYRLEAPRRASRD
jgi:hypothetical protein